MKFRTAKKEDYSAVIKLWQEAKLPFKPKGRDTKDNFEKQLNTPNIKYFLAFEKEKLIGCIIVSHNGRKGWINRLAVHPQFRRKGLGAELIRTAEAYLKKAGIEIYACLIEDWNSASMHLFQKLGYLKHDDIFYFTKRKNADV